MALTPRVERAEAIPIGIPMADGRTYEAVILRLQADGLQGLGEAAAVAERSHTIEAIYTQLTDAAEQLLTRSEALAACSGPAAAAVQTALWDLETRALGVPFNHRMGGAKAQSVVCNALIAAREPARVAAEVEAWSSRGFKAFKLKAANLGGPVDAERLGAARYAAGRDAQLRIDFNGGLSAAQADAVLSSLGVFHVRFVEQPLAPAAPVDEWHRLQQPGGIGLLADESLADPDLAGRLAAGGIGLAIKLATVGGPAAAADLARRSEGPRLIASSYETSIGIAAALHVACSLDDPEPCGLATAHLLEADLAHGLRLQDDSLLLPDPPGLGVELDLAALARYRLDR